MIQAKLNPLFVIIDPPGIQYGMPGETIEIHVVVRNEGKQSAIIDLFFTFDKIFQKVSNWSNSPRESLALAPGEISNEVTFKLEIPADALPGTYDYTFVVDSPEHYSQETPINFPGQIKVLLREQTVIRANDPIFSIQPATNPNKPLIYKPDSLLQVALKVENRSARVDRFHVTCPELDENSLKISYPQTGVEAAGLVEVKALELNPASQGEILLEFCPPSSTLAGTYSPTIRLYSANNPDLVLLDLVYIDVPPDYQISAQLNTILGKVRRNPGKYLLTLINEGNLVRELSFSARSKDEEELCKYQFEPKEIKLLPSKSVDASLIVKPRPWWRQPWIGKPLTINFQVDIEDKQELPISNQSLEGVLEWKSRPFWQLILLTLLGFGFVATAGFFIWRFLYPDPLEIESFTTQSPVLTEGDEVRLDWKISNYKQLQSLEITTKQPPRNEPLVSVTNIRNSELLSRNKNGENTPCQITTQSVLICNQFKTGITSPGKYTFEIKAVSRQRHLLFYQKNNTETKTDEIEIKQKPIAEIINVQTDKAKYQKGEDVLVSWSVKRPELLEKVDIIAKENENTQIAAPTSFKFKDGTFENPKFKDNCVKEANQINCKIALPARSVGTLMYELKAYSRNEKNRISTETTKNNIQIVSQPFNIVFFKINGSEQLNQVLNEGDKVTLTWKVEGEDIEVKLLPYQYNLPKQGKQVLEVIKNFPSPIELVVTDKSGQRQPQRKGFAISVKEKPSPPNVIIAPPIRNSPVPLPRR